MTHVAPLSCLVLIPTYDERENLPLIVERLFASVPGADVLVLDDASPDGTGDVADALAAADARVHVLHRAGKAGLGAAYLAGFAWGIERGYDLLVELDADGSHPPEVLPSMLALFEPDAATAPPALVIGSRWTRGGSVVNWPRRREALSRGANLYVGLALGIRVRDATAGFRVYRASDLAALDLGDVEAKGYGFQVDMTFRVVRAGGLVVEVPIEFRDRVIGESKMSGAIIVEAMKLVTLWGVRRRVGQLRGALRRLRPGGRR